MDTLLKICTKHEEYEKEIIFYFSSNRSIRVCQKKLVHNFKTKKEIKFPDHLEFTESQNQRMVGVGRDLCGSSSPTLLPKQGHLQ